jgi:hypothetical protein
MGYTIDTALPLSNLGKHRVDLGPWPPEEIAALMRYPYRRCSERDPE